MPTNHWVRSLVCSATAAVIPKDYSPVVIKAYFDGGNKPDSRRFRVLTLASFSGSPIQWRRFDERWVKRVQERYGAPYVHTTDMMSGAGEFSRRNGWTAKRIDDLLMDCVDLVDDSIVRHGSHGILPASVSVDLAHFKQVLADGVDIGTPDGTCSIECLGMLFKLWHLYDAAAKYQLVFDQGESFIGYVKERSVNRRSRRIEKSWNFVKDNAEASSHETPGLQIADMLAWSVNKEYEDDGCKHEWQRRLIGIADRLKTKRILKQEHLRQPNIDAMEAVRQYRLSRRARPR